MASSKGRTSTRKASPEGKGPHVELHEAVAIAAVRTALIDLLVELPPLNLADGQPWQPVARIQSDTPALSATRHGHALLSAILPHYLERHDDVGAEAVDELIAQLRGDSFFRLLHALLRRSYPSRTVRATRALRLSQAPRKNIWESFATRGDRGTGPGRSRFQLDETKVKEAIADELRHRSRADADQTDRSHPHVRQIFRLVSILRERVADLEQIRRGPKKRPPDSRAPTGALSPGAIRASTYPTPVCFVRPAEPYALLREALARNQLVMLAGPSGAGKTALALHVACELEKETRLPSWYLEPSSTGDLIHSLQSIPDSCAVVVDLGSRRLSGLTAVPAALDEKPKMTVIIVGTDETLTEMATNHLGAPTIRCDGLGQVEAIQLIDSYAQYVDLSDTLMGWVRDNLEDIQYTIRTPLAAKALVQLLRSSACEPRETSLPRAASVAANPLRASLRFADPAELRGVIVLALCDGLPTCADRPEGRLLLRNVRSAVRAFAWACVGTSDRVHLHDSYRLLVLELIRTPEYERTIRQLILEGGEALVEAIVRSPDPGRLAAFDLFWASRSIAGFRSLLLKGSIRSERSLAAQAAIYYELARKHDQDASIFLSGVLAFIAPFTSGLAGSGLNQRKDTQEWLIGEEVLVSAVAAQCIHSAIDLPLCLSAVIGVGYLSTSQWRRAVEVVASHYVAHLWRSTRRFRRPDGRWLAGYSASLELLVAGPDVIALAVVVRDERRKPVWMGLPCRLGFAGGPGRASHVAAVTGLAKVLMHLGSTLSGGFNEGTVTLQIACAWSGDDGDRALDTIGLILDCIYVPERAECDVHDVYRVADFANGAWAAARDGTIVYHEYSLDHLDAERIVIERRTVASSPFTSIDIDEGGVGNAVMRVADAMRRNYVPLLQERAYVRRDRPITFAERFAAVRGR